MLRKITYSAIIILTLSVIVAGAQKPNCKFKGDIIIQPAAPSNGDQVKIKVKVKTIRKSVKKMLIIGGVDGVQLFSKVINKADKGVDYRCKFKWQAKSGSHTFFFRVDPHNSIVESKESDNYIERTIQVSGLVQIVKLEKRFVPATSISVIPNPKMLGNITITPLVAKSGEMITFQARMKLENADAARVMISGAIDGHSKKMFDFTNMKKDEVKDLEFTWKAESGAHTVSFWIDPAKLFPDANRNDNHIKKTFNVIHTPQLISRKPHLVQTTNIMKGVVFTGPITAIPSNPVVNDQVISTATIVSIGDNEHLKFFCSNDIGGAYDSVSKEYPILKAGETRTLTLNWKAYPGENKVTCQVIQYNVENGHYDGHTVRDKKIRAFTVKRDCEKYPNELADLHLFKFVTDQPTSPNQASTAYRIIVKNWTPKCVQVFRWKIIEEEDGHEVTNGQAIGGGGNYAIESFSEKTFTSAILFRDIKNWKECTYYLDQQANMKCAHIKAIIDYDNSVPEDDETNNSKRWIIKKIAN